MILARSCGELCAILPRYKENAKQGGRPKFFHRDPKPYHPIVSKAFSSRKKEELSLFLDTKVPRKGSVLSAEDCRIPQQEDQRSKPASMAETSAQGGSGAGVVLETRNGDTQDVASSVDVSSADSSTERPLHPALAVVETFWDEMPYEDDWHMCLAQDVTFKMHVIVDPWGRKGDPEEARYLFAKSFQLCRYPNY